MKYDEQELNLRLSEYKQAAFAEFAAMGSSAVSASVESGVLSKSDKRLLATEWLESKKEEREARTETRELWKIGLAAAGVIAPIIIWILSVKWKS